MIIHDLVGTEEHSTYRELEVANGDRQRDFLRSAVQAGLQVGRDCLSLEVIKALNFHAIACLHMSAGHFRPCPVHVGEGATAYLPPDAYRLQQLMEDFVNLVNRRWMETDPVVLASFVLWRINQIHPFINGNGRTARATCYLVLCLKFQAWLPGKVILPELITMNRGPYVAALKHADSTGEIAQIHTLLNALLQTQINSAEPSLPPLHRINRRIHAERQASKGRR